MTDLSSTIPSTTTLSFLSAFDHRAETRASYRSRASYRPTTVTGSTIPIQTTCPYVPSNSTIISGDGDGVAIEPANNQTLVYMIQCCKGAPIVLIWSGCEFFCPASSKNATLDIYNCLAPGGKRLSGIQGMIGRYEEPVTTTSTTSTSTSTSRPSATNTMPSSGATVVKPSNSILVNMAAGALVIGWVVNSFA